MRYEAFLCVLLSGCSGTEFVSSVPEGGAGDAADGSGPADGSKNGDGAVTPNQISCGPNQTCKSMQTCCVGSVMGTFVFVCKDTCMAGAASLKCTKASDCPMQSVCCVRQMNGNTSSSCAMTCGPNEAQLCDPNSMPSGCAMDMPCSSDKAADWKLPDSLGTCGGKGPP